MQEVDLILSGGTVVTMDSAFTLIYDGALAVKGTEIVAVGPSDTIKAAYSARETVDCSGQYVLPGLVNAHTHVPMTLLRGYSKGFERRRDQPVPAIRNSRKPA